ncbi:MAG: DUF2797 domain-containing protein [Pseudomonadales bacterium]|nr:DUF2797 domain-containing protein [Pseudomonadales bacterium]
MRGLLRKMTVTHGDPVDYHLNLDNADTSEPLHLNPLLGQTIQMSWLSRIVCQHCGRVTNKSFSQGYCFPCFKSLAQCDLCVMSPERCHYDQGTCREPEWGQTFCMQEHIVYLANSSGLKVGITRVNQMPTRWIDQGAIQALPIMRVASRQLSGFVEVAYKKHISDKTHWQKMLKGEGEAVDLIRVRDEMAEVVKADIESLQNRHGLQALQPVTDTEPLQFRYPVLEYPEKVKSINLEKTPVFEAELRGIKGQYLIFDKGVINLRKYTGYEIGFEPV